jgi:hypothetical protein
MCRTRTRPRTGGRTRAAGRQSVPQVQSLEPRLCLAAAPQEVKFQAANYSFDDFAFSRQPASTDNVRTVRVNVPQDMQGGQTFYFPFGVGAAQYAWPQSKVITRTKPGNPPTVVQARAFCDIKVNVTVGQAAPGTTADAYLRQAVGAYTSAGFSPLRDPTDDLATWLIRGGGLDGIEPLLKSVSAVYAKSSPGPGIDIHQQLLAEVVPAGFSPNGSAVFYIATVEVETTLVSDDPTIIPLSDAAAELLQTPNATLHDAAVFAEVGPSVDFAGAVPDTLALYDFSARSTVPPALFQYLDQYEQSDLPEWGGAPGGNAAGPAAVTMALGEVGVPPPVRDVYGSTMTLGAGVPRETRQAFDWARARRVVQANVGDTAKVVTRNNDTWAGIERNLNAHAQVVLDTNLGPDPTSGGGHPILLLGVGTDPNVKTLVRELYGSDNGDYFIVADPGGHYFADPNHGGVNVGHYGTVDKLRAQAKGINYGGRFAVYPKNRLQQHASPLRTLTISPADPTVQVHAHSPVSVVITDPQGRKTGIRPDGSVLEEIPESEYQVAVLEEEGTGAVTLDPEEEKGVVISDAVPGTYQVELVGTGTGPYTLDVSVALPGQPGSTTTYTGTASPGSVEHYTFTVPGVGLPQVQQVYADSSAWTPAFRQFMQAGGIGDAALGYRVNAGDTLPWVNVNRLVLRFDRDLPASPLPQSVTLDGVRADYTARPTVLDSRSILLTSDRQLGANGGDRFRVTDDALGGSPGFAFNVLPGDVDRGGAVLANDFSDVKKKFFKSTANPGAGDTGYTVFHDVDGSGSIVAGDFSEVKKRFFNTLPAQPVITSAMVADPWRPRRNRDAYVDVLADL